MAKRPQGAKRMWVILVVVIIGWVVARLAIAAASERPVDLAPTREHFAQCPDSPNCVSSLAERRDHRVNAIQFSGSAKDAKARLRQVVEGMSGAHVLRDEGNYLYAEYRTLVFGFVDDVEFLVDEPAGVILVRSASRLGYSDLGANRRRVEAIRAKFAAAK